MDTNASRKRFPLAKLSNTTFGDFLSNPDKLVGPADLASADIVRSYPTIARWVDKGELRKPMRLPSGRIVWRAGDVLDDLGLQQPQPNSDPGTPAEA